MTLMYEFHLDVVKMYLRIPKMKFLGQGFRTLELKHEETHTDTQTRLDALTSANRVYNTVVTCELKLF